LLVAAAGLLAVASGCSSRVEVPEETASSTLSFAPRSGEGVTAEITLCRYVSKKTGEPVGTGQEFTIGEKSKVRALVALDGVPDARERPLDFHVVWLGPDRREFYTKRLEHACGDDGDVLESAVSMRPGRREPGDYAVQIYLFRELIAEKRFEVLAGESQPS
jgi:hypothetical protein